MFRLARRRPYGKVYASGPAGPVELGAGTDLTATHFPVFLQNVAKDSDQGHWITQSSGIYATHVFTGNVGEIVH